MPRDGSKTLSALRDRLRLVCGPCARRERFSVARLIEHRGDARLIDLRLVLANCLPVSSSRFGLLSKMVKQEHLKWMESGYLLKGRNGRGSGRPNLTL